MTNKTIRIGTRDSQLAVWQATTVSNMLSALGYICELVYIKSEGDTDLKTPLYEMGVQGIFTRALDTALINEKIDVAVHSMKDVPVVMAHGVVQAAVLPRASYRDLLVPGPGYVADGLADSARLIGTSSTRRKAQWLHRYPGDGMENLRGNVNTRLRKVSESGWHGAIFAAAGLERIGLRPENAIELEWMLPAPAQGAVVVVCREGETWLQDACAGINDENTALCVRAERDFLRALNGGCSTPISALAEVYGDRLRLSGNILSPDGVDIASVDMDVPLEGSEGIGMQAGGYVLENGGREILAAIN